jgi:hypothetical protein
MYWPIIFAASMLRDVYDVNLCGAATPDPYGDLVVMVLATRKR